MCTEKIKIAIHKNSDVGYFDEKWIKILSEFKDIELKVLDFEDSNVFEELCKCDGVMWHFVHNPHDKNSAPRILNALENDCHIKVWPNQSTRCSFDEKITQYYILKSQQVPMVPTKVFWNYNEAKTFVEETEYPIVAKLSVGAGGSNVILLNDISQALDYLKKSFFEGIYPYSMNEWKKKISLKKRIKNAIRILCGFDHTIIPRYWLIQKEYVYFQKYIKNNAYDIRVTVIGRRVFGFIRYNRENDFRASGSGRIDYNPQNIPVEALKIALQLSLKNGYQSMAYDFLFDDGQYLISEMSYGYADYAIHNCPGYWDEDLIWHKGNFWPEELHVIDFIKEIKGNS